jgi:branched-chain amino acid transport system substrate-binding protein
MLIPTSGVYAAIAADIQDGFNLFVEQQGGLGGCGVQLIVADTEANPEVGLRAASRLIEQDQIDIATGVVSSAVALQVRSLFEESRVPLVISNAVATVITGEQRSDYVFRVSQSGYQASYPAGQWVFDNLTEGPVFISAPDYAAGQEIAKYFEEGFTDAGGTVAGRQFPPFQGTHDYQPFLTEIRNSGAEAVFAFYAGAEAINFIQQYDQFGLRGQIPIIGPGALVSDDIISAQGDAALGTYVVTPYAWTLDNPTNRAFVEAYEQKTGRKPSYFAVYSYDAAQLIAAALEAAGCDPAPEDLVGAMEGFEIDSPRGPVTIDSETHGTVQPIYIAQIQEVDGEPAPVVIEEVGVFGEQPE